MIDYEMFCRGFEDGRSSGPPLLTVEEYAHAMRRAEAAGRSYIAGYYAAMIYLAKILDKHLRDGEN